MGDPTSIVCLESTDMKDIINYEDLRVDILDYQVRILTNKEVASVKILWSSKSA